MKRTVTKHRIPITNLVPKTVFVDKRTVQFNSRDQKKILLVQRIAQDPGIAYEVPAKHLYYLGDSRNGDLDSVVALTEAMAVAWLLSEGYTYSDFA